MTIKLLLFAFYYLCVGLFAPNPVPNEPNKFALAMLWVSLGFSLVALLTFIWDVLPDEETDENVDFVGVQGYQLAHVEDER